MDTISAKEQTVGQWFAMWLQKTDRGIERIFAPDAVYTECWGPCYQGVGQIKGWFEEWNTRGTVLRWDIRQFFHRDDWTAVEWHFVCAMGGEAPAAFDGMTLIQWTAEGKIGALKEFGCKIGE